MNKISQLLNSKYPTIKHIDSKNLSTSGTGYIYPKFCNETITQFTDCGRLGYLIQFSMIDTNTQEIKRSCFIVHERYTGCAYTVVYSGPDEFYNDCLIRVNDFDLFMERLEKLLNGEQVDGLFNRELDECEQHLNNHAKFQLGTSGTNVYQRPFLCVVEKSSI